MTTDWYNATKRFGIDCFLRAENANSGGDGIARQFFDTVEEVDAWAEKALAAGRFKYLVCYDSISGTWEWSHDYGPTTQKHEKPRKKSTTKSLSSKNMRKGINKKSGAKKSTTN